PTGSWQDAAESSASGTPPTVVTSGDRRIDDPILVMSAPGVFELTDPDGVVYTVTATSGPDYPIVIDVGAGSVVDDSEADARDAVSFSHRAWLRLEPGVTQSITSTVACTV